GHIDSPADGGGDRMGQFVLHREDIAQVAVVTLGPYVIACLRFDQLRGNGNRSPERRILPSMTYWTPSSLPTRRTSTALSRNWNDEFRAITNNERNRDSSVMMSSVMPSLKYCCSGSPLKLVKGRTAIDGLLFGAAVGPVATFIRGDGGAVSCWIWRN